MATNDRASSSATWGSARGKGKAIAEDTLFVSVSRQVGESKSALLWSLENRGDSQICLIHVHQPDKFISVGVGPSVPIEQFSENQIEAHRVKERKRLSEKMDEHLQICSQHNVKAQIIHIEMDSIQKGIVILIKDYKIEKLVMGGASDSRFSRSMMEILSEKAKYVRNHAPGYCHIWFVCRKLLIHTREATESTENLNSASPGFNSVPSTPDSRTEKSDVYYSAMAEQVDKYKKERDDAIKQVEELRRQLMEGVSFVEFPTFCYELRFQQIEKATNTFDPVLKIGENTNGNTYKGFFNLKVAVWVPHPNPSSPHEFQQQVEIMSKVRHPNIVNLISICPESQALIYEYCENGNLEGKLNSEVEGSPLPWKTRIRISIELCSVLMFLHSHKPDPIIHGDIRPENIHLDSNDTCKLNDFRVSTMISSKTFSLQNYGVVRHAHIDPEYFQNDDLTTKSDVYSYGIILLRLLTGKPAERLIRQVQNAIDTDELAPLLDPRAEWPLEQAKQLAVLALKCCEMTRRSRPELDPDVWKVLESIKGLSD